MNKQQLAAKIWESANRMRSKIEANEYKDYILGFIFYKYLSDLQERHLREEGSQDELENTPENELAAYASENWGYYIPREHLYSHWLKMGADFTPACVTDALSSFNRHISSAHKRVFEGIFHILETGLSKLGDTTQSLTRALRDLIWLIRDIPMDGRQDYDVLGFIYEYLISNFAANAGKKAGEFYTPHEVSLLISELVAWHLRGKKEIRIYDPTSGSGSLLINIGHCAARYLEPERIRYFAQELKENTYNLTRMNLVMRGINAANIDTRNADTLEEDWPRESNSNEPLYVDAVVSNPPYSQAWNPDNKEGDGRFSAFGLAPRGKADYAFLLHDLHHLKPDGIMAIILPHGVLFRGGEEGNIRKNLIERNHIDAIIGLPANIFFGTGIPTIIVLLRQQRDHSDVLIIDASRGFAKKGKNNVLRSRDIRKIVDVATGRKEVPGFSRRVSRDEIRDNGYNLNIPRYVDSSEAAEPWDMFSLLAGGVPERELDALDSYWQALPGLKESLFEPQNAACSRLKVEDAAAHILAHPSVANFLSRFDSAFADFADYLEATLVEKAEILDIATAKEQVAADIFSRFKDIPIIDPYDAYQIFAECWTKVATDLEMLQNEACDARRAYEPRLVLKKVAGKDVETQDGWQGRIMPFELVQREYLAEDLQKLRDMEDELAGYASLYAEFLDLPDWEDSSIVKDEAFVPAEVKKALKEQLCEPETLKILKKVSALLEKEKKLKKKLKDAAAALHEATRQKLASLTDAEARHLLKCAWIEPMQEKIMALPRLALDELAARVEEVSKKYADTLPAIDGEIQAAEKELCAMFADLEGNEFDMQALASLKKLLGGEQ